LDVRTKEKRPLPRALPGVKVLPFHEQTGESSRDDDLLNARGRRLLPFFRAAKGITFFLRCQASAAVFCRISQVFTPNLRLFLTRTVRVGVDKAQKSRYITTAL
jgi:hypothetical protein